MTGVDVDLPAAARRAHRMTGTVNGTIAIAGVLAVAAVDDKLTALQAGAYALGTLVVFWLAHGWAHALGMRDAGLTGYDLLRGVRDELPVLAAGIPPLTVLLVSAILEFDVVDAITAAAWVCVGQLALLGAGIARRERASPARILLTAVGCGSLGFVMILLKTLVS